MDPALIAQLVGTLGPLVVPLLSAASTWLIHWFVGKLSPGAQVVLTPFLPAVAAASGLAIGSTTGLPPLTGAVMGLAGTGLHQLGHQVFKAAKK